MARIQFPLRLELGAGSYEIQSYPFGGPHLGGKQYPTYEDLRDAVVEQAALLIESVGARVKSIQMTRGDRAEALRRMDGPSVATATEGAQIEAQELERDIGLRGLVPGDLRPLETLNNLFSVNPAAVTGGGMFAIGGGAREFLAWLRQAEVDGVRVRDALLQGVIRTDKTSGKSMGLREPGALEWAFQYNDGEYFALIMVLVGAYFGSAVSVPFVGVTNFFGSLMGSSEG